MPTVYPNATARPRATAACPDATMRRRGRRATGFLHGSKARAAGAARRPPRCRQAPAAVPARRRVGGLPLGRGRRRAEPRRADGDGRRRTPRGRARDPPSARRDLPGRAVRRGPLPATHPPERRVPHARGPSARGRRAGGDRDRRGAAGLLLQRGRRRDFARPATRRELPRRVAGGNAERQQRERVVHVPRPRPGGARGPRGRGRAWPRRAPGPRPRRDAGESRLPGVRDGRGGDGGPSSRLDVPLLARPARPGGAAPQAHHGAEIPYALDTPDDWLRRDADDDGLTAEMLGYWSHFARHDDPNGIGR